MEFKYNEEKELVKKLLRSLTNAWSLNLANDGLEKTLIDYQRVVAKARMLGISTAPVTFPNGDPIFKKIRLEYPEERMFCSDLNRTITSLCKELQVGEVSVRRQRIGDTYHIEIEYRNLSLEEKYELDKRKTKIK